MIVTNVKITNPTGIHVGPAAILSDIAQHYQSKITIFYEYRQINAKSLMNILSGCIRPGTKLKIEFDGPDEQEAMTAFITTIKNDLGEVL
jgi:phosphocarrier protein